MDQCCESSRRRRTTSAQALGTQDRCASGAIVLRPSTLRPGPAAVLSKKNKTPMEVLAEAASTALEGGVAGPAPSYTFPYTLPPDFAVICRNPGDGRFYCQVPGCGAVLGSTQRSYDHLKAAHDRYPRNKRRIMIKKVVPVVADEKAARRKQLHNQHKRLSRRRISEQLASVKAAASPPFHVSGCDANDPVILAVAGSKGVAFPLKVHLSEGGRGELSTVGMLNKAAKEAVSVALSWANRSGGQLAQWVERGAGGGAAEAQEGVWVGGSRDLCLSFQDSRNLRKGGASLGAGVALGVAVALLQLRLGRDRVSMREGVAVTGEVNLRGELLAVHGIAEKLRAAYQSGCRLVVLPSANRRELQQAMEAAAAEGATRQWLEQTVVLAQDMVDVLSHAVAGFPERPPDTAVLSQERLGVGRPVLHVVGQRWQCPTVEAALVPGGSGKTLVTGGVTAEVQDEIACALMWGRQYWREMAQAVRGGQQGGRGEGPLLPLAEGADLHIHLSPGMPGAAWKADRAVGAAVRIALSSLVLGIPVPSDVGVVGRVAFPQGLMVGVTPQECEATRQLWVNAVEVQGFKRLLVAEGSVQAIQQSGAEEADLRVHGANTITTGLAHIFQTMTM